MAGQSASFDDQDDLINTSFVKNHEHGGKKLSDEIAVMIESSKLPGLPYHQSKCCIYKVSDEIRKSNEQAYTPQVISIGPFHRNNPKLQEMESLKLRYLESFGKRVETNLEEIVDTIKHEEANVRECYSDRETPPLDSDDFVKMILVDASFIIEFFLKNKSKVNWTEYDKEILKPELCDRMQMDLILLENQLPFFIIKKIYDTAFPSRSERDHPFIELCFCQFQYYNVQNSCYSQSEQILHFTDLLRNFFLPPREKRPKRYSKIIEPEMKSATQLAAVGLKFKTMSIYSSNCSPLELKYAANGVLEIPRIQLDINTEIYAQNLIAFEKCHYPESAYITDYYFLLSLLIRDERDVVFLVRKEILIKRVNGIDATSVLNKISKNIDSSLMNDDYGRIFEKTNKFYEDRNTYLKHTMAILKSDYFCNPWRGAATIGGILLLLLTVIQTVCSVISVK